MLVLHATALDHELTLVDRAGESWYRNVLLVYHGIRERDWLLSTVWLLALHGDGWRFEVLRRLIRRLSGQEFAHLFDRHFWDLGDLFHLVIKHGYGGLRVLEIGDFYLFGGGARRSRPDRLTWFWDLLQIHNHTVFIHLVLRVFDDFLVPFYLLYFFDLFSHILEQDIDLRLHDSWFGTSLVFQLVWVEIWTHWLYMLRTSGDRRGIS